MEKFSVLLFGRNKVIIDDFFLYHEDNLECLSASSHNEDLLNHLKYYQPDAFIYCMQEESPEDIQQIKIVRMMEHTDIPLIVIGQPKECDDFMEASGNISSLILRRPMSIGQIQERIISLLNQKKREQLKIEAAQTVKKHILVIDDDRLMLKVINEHLRKDYEVATAISGKVAMKYLQNKKVDLILLDYQMPEESGPEIMEKLQQNEETRNIPVIFLTGVKEREKIRKALALKPNGYLLKPIDHDQLMEAITKQLSSEEG